MSDTYSHITDAELTTYYSPNKNHPQSSNIAAVYDEFQRPLVFSISQDSSNPNSASQLCMTFADPVTGQNILVNLSAIFGVSAWGITFVTASQDDASNVYLAFAVAPQTGNQSFSNIYLCKGATPAVWRQTDTLRSLLIPPTQNIQVDLQELWLVDTVSLAATYTDSDYPLLLIRGVVSVTSQVARIKVHAGAWSVMSAEFAITIDPTVLLDTAFGWTGPGKLSLMTLLTDSSGNAVLEASHYSPRFPSGGTTTTELYAPSGARKLSVVQNTNGFYDLIIAGNGLHHYKAGDLGYSGPTVPQPTEIISPDDPFFNGVQEMITCQDGTSVPIWIRTADSSSSPPTSNICRTTITTQPDGSLSLDSPTYPIHTGPVLALTPIFHNATQSQHFLFLDDQGYHYLLKYKPINQVWDEGVWLIPALNEEAYTAVTSYSINITLLDSNNHPVPNLTLDVVPSDSVTAIANANTVSMVGNSTSSVTTDGQGRLVMIVPVDGVGSACVFQLSYNGIAVGPPINPATNLQNRLAPITSGSVLQSQKLSDGSPLFSGSTSGINFDDAAAAMQSLQGQLSNVPPDGSIKPSDTLMSASLMSADDIADDFWAAWHWIENTAQQTPGWVRDEAGNIWKFTMTLGNETKTFLVNSVTRVLKAITYVFKQVQLKIEEIIAWIGFLFDWSTIKTIQADLSNITTTVYNQINAWTTSGVGATNDAITIVFNTLETMLNNMDPTGTSNSAFHVATVAGTANQTSTSSATFSADINGQINAVSSHPGANWSTYSVSSGQITNDAYVPDSSSAVARVGKPQRKETRLPYSRVILRTVQYNGQAVGSSKVKENHSALTKAGVGDDQEFVTDVLVPFASSVETVIDDFVTNLGTLVQAKMDQIGDDLVHLLVQFATDVLNALKTLIEGALNYAESYFTKLISDALSAELVIPYLSALVKDFIPDFALGTQLGITCLLIAIPTAVVGKVSDVGLEWPDMSGFSPTMTAISFPTGWVQTFQNWATTFASSSSLSSSSERPPLPAAAVTHVGEMQATDPSWQAFSQGSSIAHPFAKALEYVESDVTAAAASPGKNAPAELLSLHAMSGLVTCALSVPNEGSRLGDSSSLSDIALDIEWAGWGVRALETVLLLACLKREEDPEFKAKVSLAMSIIGQLLQIASASVRQSYLTSQISATSGSDQKRYQAASTANGVGFGALFAGLCTSMLRDASLLAPEEVKPALLEYSAIFGACDFGLDLGQAIYVAYENGQNDWSNTYWPGS